VIATYASVETDPVARGLAFGRSMSEQVEGTAVVYERLFRSVRGLSQRDLYCGVMMGQVDQLLANGHPYSEVANESVIECVDSLNPYMHAHGVAYMIDNCSITARLGARKWAPRFDYLLEQITLPLLREPQSLDMSPFDDFESHVVHDVLRTCAELRSSVDVYVE